MNLEATQEWWAEEGGRRVRMESTPQGLKITVIGAAPDETVTLAWFRANRLLSLFPSQKPQLEKD